MSNTVTAGSAPDVELFMSPDLKPYGKSVWRATLAMLDGETLSPADYVLLESFCQAAEQLREINSKIKSEPFTVVDGMMKANTLGIHAQAVIRSVVVLSDKLGINRSMRNAGGNGAIHRELQDFLRGVDNHGSKLSV